MTKKIILKNFIISRVMLLIIFLLPTIHTLDVAESIWIYDATHYLDIATNGYHSEYLYAFFPLFPLVLRLLKYISPNITTLTLYIVAFNSLLAYLSTIMISSLIKTNTPNDSTQVLMLKIWLYSPISLFTLLPYTESLFIFLTLLTYCLYKSNNHYVLTGIFLGLSVTTRSFGSVLFFAIFIGMLFKKTPLLNILKTYIPATLLSCTYPIFLFFTTGHWNMFTKVQFTHWWRVKSNIVKCFAVDFKKMQTNSSLANQLLLIIMVLSIICISIVLIKLISSLIKKDLSELELLLYALVSIVAVYSTMRDSVDYACTISFHRYLLGIFPVYIFMPQHKKLLKPIFIVFMVLTIFITLFLGFGFFIA